MNLVVRRASLVEDRDEIVELLNRNFEPGQDARFDWRHLNHPAGPAWCWFVYDRDSKKNIATASVFPRRMLVDGQPVQCGQVGGFAVDASYRSLGPAVLMQRATFEPVDEGVLAFCYDCPPHDRGMSTFVRLGMRANCEVIRYALPLRCDDYLQARLGYNQWGRPLIAAGNVLLRVKNASCFVRSAVPGLEVSLFTGKFDDEFSYLDRNLRTPNEVRSLRSAEVLNWLYRENPKSTFGVLVARRFGELMGYLTFLPSKGRVTIVDIFGRQLTEVGKALLGALIDLSRREKWSLLEGSCASASGLPSVYLQVGFQQREKAAHVVAYEKSTGGTATLLTASLRWAFNGFEMSV